MLDDHLDVEDAGLLELIAGRIALAIAPSKSSRVYAFVESTDSALYVSDDAKGTIYRITYDAR